MKITFNDFEFEGLKLNKYVDFPWANSKEKTDFYENLVKNSTNYNKDKAKRFCEMEAKESIHINLSRSYIATGISIFGLILMAMMITTMSLGLTLGLSGLVIVGLVGKWIFRKKASFELFGLKMDNQFIDMIF
jgi:hypothetical protein